MLLGEAPGACGNQISAGVAAIDKQNELMGLKIQRVESKRVDKFANMSDEELRLKLNAGR